MAVKCGGLKYSKQGRPVVWGDQFFEDTIEATGEKTLANALRVGSTGSRLNVALTGNGENAGEFKAESGAAITMTFLVSDSKDGEFTPEGPTLCVTAPADGITCEPNEILWRAPLQSFSKPWLKVKLKFEGTFTGGKLDCFLTDSHAS